MSNESGVSPLDLGQGSGVVQAAKTLSGLAALGCAVAAAALLSLEDPYLRRVGWGWFVEAAFCATAWALLYVRRGWSPTQAEALSLLLIATTFVAQVHADWYSALSSARFAPFEGFKILALTVATVLPFRPAFAYALVGACAVIPVVVYEVMPAQMRAELPMEAPWTTVIYPLIATGILMYRVRAKRLEREMIRAAAQREGLERLAKVSLAYRDLVNSPLQTMELLRAGLYKDHPESKELLENLRRSIRRLRAMGEMLSETEHDVVWTSKEEAFDAAQVIADYRRTAAN